MSTYQWSACAAVLLVLFGGTVQAQSIFDGLLDRTKKSAEQKTRDRFNQRIDQTIDKGMNKTEEAVHCVATDQECLNQAKNQGKPVSIVNPPATPSDSAKCLMTDTDCLKQAKAQGKKVELVEEKDLDTLRCAATDPECLRRAKTMGKKVEIID